MSDLYVISAVAKDQPGLVYSVARILAKLRINIVDIDARSRREFTAIDLAVNVAARLQELTKALGKPTLVSRTTRDRVEIAFERVGEVEVRGLSEPMEVFVPVDSAPPVPRST